MEPRDDELENFEANGAPPLPAAAEQGFVDHDGARIRYATYGAGFPVVLLHGGFGHGGNWGYQVPALTDAGYRAVLVDSRGHGRSTRDQRPFTYDLMASDVVAVMDRLELERAAFVGWSDGACSALVLASRTPMRSAGVFFFACNMDPSGTKEFQPGPVVDRCFARHTKDYAALSPTPDGFMSLVGDVSAMQKTEPNYSVRDLARIEVPVTIVQGEHDEFIKREHAEYLARSIPGADLVILPGVSHFAPLQRPQLFNEAVGTWLEKLLMGAG